MDCTVRSWLYGTVAPDLIEITMTLKPTAHSLWLALEDQFIGNHKTRAMILDVEFRIACLPSGTDFFLLFLKKNQEINRAKLIFKI
jgi:hypothetical protein